MQVGLGQMPGVAGFGKKAQVGKLEFFYQSLPGFLTPGIYALNHQRSNVDQRYESDEVERHKNQKNV